MLSTPSGLRVATQNNSNKSLFDIKEMNERMDERTPETYSWHRRVLVNAAILILLKEQNTE